MQKYFLHKFNTSATVKTKVQIVNKNAPPPQHKALDNFKRDLTDLVRNIKFHQQLKTFQNKLKQDITKINNSLNVFIPANQNGNLYELSHSPPPIAKHKKLLKDNIAKTYREAPKNTDYIKMEDKKIAQTLNLDDQINNITKT